MSVTPYKNVKLTMADQFGPDGPQPGATGRTLGEPFNDEGEIWYHVKFNGFGFSFFNVREDMIELSEGY